MLMLGLHNDDGISGAAVAVTSSAPADPVGEGSSGEMDTSLPSEGSGAGSVTVGARISVAVAGPPAGDGDESGVAKMFGVGVGGFNRLAGSVGATLRFT